MQVVFWASIAVLVYTYFGYPLLLWLMARVSPKPVRAGSYQPQVVIVVVCHNEQKRIIAKLETCLAQDYPADRLRVLIASDGSTDDTVALVNNYHDKRVGALDFSARRGKAACLNDAIATCSEEVIVLMDSRQRVNPQAVSALVANLADESVGAVSGELVFVQDDLTPFAEGIDAYWRYEKFIRHHEALSGSVVGVTGAIYAIRRQCFEPISPQTILDDVAIPMQAAMKGWRVVFEKQAIAYDQPSAASAQERVRKVRTLAGNFQLMSLLPGLLVPWRNPLFVRFVSHKVLRLVAPFAMAVALLGNVVLALQSSAYALLLVPHVLFYVLALLPELWSGAARLLPVKIASAFLHLNAFVVLGLIEFLSNKEAHLWRQGAAAPAAGEASSQAKAPGKHL